jgi:hypothetical protein
MLPQNKGIEWLIVRVVQSFVTSEVFEHTLNITICGWLVVSSIFYFPSYMG